MTNNQYPLPPASDVANTHRQRSPPLGEIPPRPRHQILHRRRSRRRCRNQRRRCCPKQRRHRRQNQRRRRHQTLRCRCRRRRWEARLPAGSQRRRRADRAAWQATAALRAQRPRAPAEAGRPATAGGGPSASPTVMAAHSHVTPGPLLLLFCFARSKPKHQDGPGDKTRALLAPVFSLQSRSLSTVQLAHPVQATLSCSCGRHSGLLMT